MSIGAVSLNGFPPADSHSGDVPRRDLIREGGRFPGKVSMERKSVSDGSLNRKQRILANVNRPSLLFHVYNPDLQTILTSLPCSDRKFESFPKITENSKAISCSRVKVNSWLLNSEEIDCFVAPSIIT